MVRVTLAEARRHRVLSVRKLAEASGLSPTTIYYIEHGRTVPSFRAIRDLSAALDVDPLDIAEFAAVIEGTGAGQGKAVAA